MHVIGRLMLHAAQNSGSTSAQTSGRHMPDQWHPRLLRLHGQVRGTPIHTPAHMCTHAPRRGMLALAAPSAQSCPSPPPEPLRPPPVLVSPRRLARESTLVPAPQLEPAARSPAGRPAALLMLTRRLARTSFDRNHQRGRWAAGSTQPTAPSVRKRASLRPQDSLFARLPLSDPKLCHKIGLLSPLKVNIF